nr:bacteriocin biosynthesis cyclodehydratase domain [Streptococcus thermophilus]
MGDSTLVRLAPGVNVLVRGEGAVQFGLDASRSAVLDTAHPRQLKDILDAAVKPTTVRDVLNALRGLAGIAEPEARALVNDLLGYRILVDASARTVVVLGTSALADEVVRLLRAAGITVRTPLIDEPLRPFISLHSPDVPVVVVDHFPQLVRLREALAGHAGWIIPVFTLDSRVVVGPASVSGDGPCLECVLMHAQDRDPHTHAAATALAQALTANGPDPTVIAAGAAAAAVVVSRCAEISGPPGVLVPQAQPGIAQVIDPFGPQWVTGPAPGK